MQEITKLLQFVFLAKEIMYSSGQKLAVTSHCLLMFTSFTCVAIWLHV